MAIAEKDGAANDTHSFVIRLRINEPMDPIPPVLGRLGLDGNSSGDAGSSRLSIRVEHVNSSDLSQHHSIAGALEWLGARMRELVGSGDADASSAEKSGPWTH